MKQGRWEIERCRPGGVVPLQVWDLPGSGEPLFRRIGTPRIEALKRSGADDSRISEVFARELEEVLRQIWEGGVSPALEAARGFDLVHLSGGLTRFPGLRDSFESRPAPFSVSWGAGGRFGGERGGLCLLKQLADGRGIVVDVGATAVKVTAQGDGRHRLVVERDSEAVPLLSSTNGVSLAAGQQERARGHSVAMIVTAIRRSVGFEPAPPAIVLALPAWVSDACIPGRCSYPGWEGDGRLVPDILDAMASLEEEGSPELKRLWRGSAEWRAWVLEDSELVAYSALEQIERETDRFTRALVVNLGYGPGIALVERSR